MKPTLREEKILWLSGYEYVIGIDEVGRGSFAGPVVAAAVVLNPDAYFSFYSEINDSKVLSEQKRIMLAQLIRKYCIAYAISEIAVDTIDSIGVGKATNIAFCKVLSEIAKKVKNASCFALLDGYGLHCLPKAIANHKGIIHGDRKSISVAAASIIAKVYRDTKMKQYHRIYPEYAFIRNKGYGTPEHQTSINNNGLTILHRKTFCKV